MTNLPRQLRARAFSPWTAEEDETLRRRSQEGRTIVEIARLHGREPHVIRQRQQRLGLLEPPSASAA